MVFKKKRTVSLNEVGGKHKGSGPGTPKPVKASSAKAENRGKAPIRREDGRVAAKRPGGGSGPTGPGRPKTRKKPWKLDWRIKIFFFLFPLALIPVIAVWVAYENYTQDLPSIDALQNYQPKTVSYILSDDGRVIGEFFQEHRLVVSLNRIPKHVVGAFLAAEDANFFNHPGLDIPGIFRAFVANIKAGRIVQGGSTITQQVTRSFLLSSEKTYGRKIKEAILAYRIEQNLTKEDILFLYLNQIYLGRGAYGVESAAQIYFDKHVSDLSIAEASLIAGLTRAPGRYSPFRTPKLARSRQVYVINQMLDSGFISSEEAMAAINEKLIFARRRPNTFLETTPDFTEQVRRQVEDLVGPERLYTDGLRIYSTVNIESQFLARKAVKFGLAAWSKRQGYGGPRKKAGKGRMEILSESAAAGFRWKTHLSGR